MGLYTYDNLNRVTLADYPDDVNNIEYTYDEEGTNGKGRLTTMADLRGRSLLAMMPGGG
jgi:hypothetical protein